MIIKKDMQKYGKSARGIFWEYSRLDVIEDRNLLDLWAYRIDPSPRQ